MSELTQEEKDPYVLVLGSRACHIEKTVKHCLSNDILKVIYRLVKSGIPHTIVISQDCFMLYRETDSLEEQNAKRALVAKFATQLLEEANKAGHAKFACTLDLEIHPPIRRSLEELLGQINYVLNHFSEVKISKRQHERAILSTGRHFEMFARNGVWGTCTDCPVITDGRGNYSNTIPELCANFDRYDHRLTLNDLVEKYNAASK